MILLSLYFLNLLLGKGKTDLVDHKKFDYAQITLKAVTTHYCYEKGATELSLRTFYLTGPQYTFNLNSIACNLWKQRMGRVDEFNTSFIGQMW